MTVKGLIKSVIDLVPRTDKFRSFLLRMTFLRQILSRIPILKTFLGLFPTSRFWVHENYFTFIFFPTLIGNWVLTKLWRGEIYHVSSIRYNVALLESFKWKIVLILGKLPIFFVFSL